MTMERFAWMPGDVELDVTEPGEFGGVALSRRFAEALSFVNPKPERRDELITALGHAASFSEAPTVVQDFILMAERKAGKI